MSHYYEYQALLTGLDVDGRGFCKPSALLNHLQVAAMLAGEVGGFGREALQKEHQAFWMLARSWYQLERPLRYAETITIRTWYRSGKGAIMYRDYDILADGKLVGESVSGWVLANLETHRLMPLSILGDLTGKDGGELCKTKTLSKLRCPEQLQEVERRLMRYSDMDVNGHINNTRYADFACDALELDKLGENQFFSSMQIGYLAECRPGEVLTIQTGELEEGKYVRGVDEGGKSRFETALFFSEVRA
jgi:acyl-ACP thioesterase